MVVAYDLVSVGKSPPHVQLARGWIARVRDVAAHADMVEIEGVALRFVEREEWRKWHRLELDGMRQAIDCYVLGEEIRELAL